METQQYFPFYCYDIVDPVNSIINVEGVTMEHNNAFPFLLLTYMSLSTI